MVDAREFCPGIGGAGRFGLIFVVLEGSWRLFLGGSGDFARMLLEFVSGACVSLLVKEKRAGVSYSSNSATVDSAPKLTRFSNPRAKPSPKLCATVPTTSVTIFLVFFVLPDL